MIWLFLACATEPESAAPPAVERGTGEFAGMVRVPEAKVRSGASGESRPPPVPPGGPPAGAAGPPLGPGGAPLAPKAEVPVPDVPCSTDEITTGTCPALEHTSLAVREVLVSAFWIDELEVTRAQYGTFLAETGYRPPHVEEEWAEKEWNWDGATPPAGTEDHPVVLTNWYDAREYCTWRGARLPTEAEWHLAAHGPAGDEWDYPWGDTYEEGRMNRGQLAPPNYDDADGYLTTSPVAHYPGGVSRYGANDLFGNAWEWVADVRVRSWSQVQFADVGASRDPHTTTLGLYAGARGFSYFADPRPNLAMGHNAFPVELRRKTSGFRCAKSAAASGR